MTELGELEELGDGMWTVLEQLARGLRLPRTDVDATLTAICASAVDTVTPARWSGVILIARGGTLQPQATHGEPAELLDRWQQQNGIGPCVEAAVEQSVVSVPDTGAETRWPGFGLRAAALGVGSMLCVSLWVDQQRLGTLSLYSEQRDAFSDHDLRLTRLYATYAALALADARRIEQLGDAVASRDLIGQAKGILMERHKLTADAAFSMLAGASQTTNQKLTVIADHLVATGELLGVR